MKKSILFILSVIIMINVYAETKYPVTRTIPVRWDLGTVDIAEKAVPTLHEVKEDNTPGDIIYTLALDVSGLKASKKFFISLDIVSRDIVSINVRATSNSEDNPGALLNSDGTRTINWYLLKQNEEDIESLETIINGKDYISSTRLYDHYPSLNGLVSKEDILLEIETDRFSMSDIGDSYSTKIYIDVVDVGGGN